MHSEEKKSKKMKENNLDCSERVDEEASVTEQTDLLQRKREVAAAVTKRPPFLLSTYPPHSPSVATC